jgi:hypothetical protein
MLVHELLGETFEHFLCFRILAGPHRDRDIGLRVESRRALLGATTGESGDERRGCDYRPERSKA